MYKLLFDASYLSEILSNVPAMFLSINPKIYELLYSLKIFCVLCDNKCANSSPEHAIKMSF